MTRTCKCGGRVVSMWDVQRWSKERGWYTVYGVYACKSCKRRFTQRVRQPDRFMDKSGQGRGK